MDERTQVTDVHVDPARCVVDVTYADGEACRFTFAELRAHCPCAECRGRRDLGAAPWSPVAGAPDLAVDDARLVGAYGLGLTWNDGHAAGIFPFDALRAWCDQGAPAFTADSGRGA